MEEMTGIDPGVWPQATMVCFILFDLFWGAWVHGQVRMQKVTLERFLLHWGPRYAIWWAGGYFGVLGWPQWLHIGIAIYMSWVVIKYEGFVLAEERSFWGMLAAVCLNIFLLYMGGFWG